MPEPRYLQPYLNASRKFGGGFGSLLWASPKTQAVRFSAIAGSTDIHGRVVLDAGCGRADLLDYLLARGIEPAKYIGIEAVDALANAAEEKHHQNVEIVRGDFVSNPRLLIGQADVIVFSGSLNTLAPADFFHTLNAAWKNARHELAFNFLCSPFLAAKEFLNWYPISDILVFASALTNNVIVKDQYLKGDCLLVMRKS